MCSTASLWLVTKLILKCSHDWPTVMQFMGEKIWTTFCDINILWWPFFSRTKANKQWLLERVWREGKPLNCWWECKLLQPLWRIVWRFLKKLKIEMSYDPAIPLLGIYLEKNMIQENTSPWCSLQRYWQQPRHGRNRNVHWQRNG